MRRASSFGAVVAGARAAGQLVVQPRIGMSDPAQMRAGLLATKHADATTVGTITLDSYTRIGDHAAARRAVRDGVALNGYPIVAHDIVTTLGVLGGVREGSFPVQVRHGSAAPLEVFRALVALGIDATEGGPVSYCLPYGRTPLHASVRNWSEGCELFARLRDLGAEPHLETFGGCMLGQLCPPSLLVALSVLEALFFRQRGLRSVSLSYAQQTNTEQDAEAIGALRRIAGELLADIDWHVVLYAYMGVYPRTAGGALMLLETAAGLAVRSGCARLIVKTTAEAHRIPAIGENVAALEVAAAAARTAAAERPPHPDSEVYTEARAIVDAVLDLHVDLGSALVIAFRRGLLDVPYCLHPDNAGRTRSVIDGAGRLRWSDAGALPIVQPRGPRKTRGMTATELLSSLSFVASEFDRLAAGDSPPARVRAYPDWSA